MVGDVADVIHLEEVTVRLEHLLQVAVAELRHDVDLVEILEGLAFGDDDVDHLHDVGVFAVLQQHQFPKDPAGFRLRLKQVGDLLDGHVPLRPLVDCLRHMPVRPLPDNLLDLVVLKILRREDLVLVGGHFRFWWR